MKELSPPPCSIVFGGCFDPVHAGHVKIAECLVQLLHPTQLRLVPTGRSELKAACHASPQQRIEMLKLAFARLAESISLVIDEQEIHRAELGIASYSVDTLTSIRTESGPDASLVLLIGADQLQQLHQWKNWAHLFELAHVAVAARPGSTLDAVDRSISSELRQRIGTIEQLRTQPYGHTYWLTDSAIDIASTQIRNGDNLALVPPDVLNYIQQHQIY